MPALLLSSFFGVILKCVILFTPLSAWEVSVCLSVCCSQAGLLLIQIVFTIEVVVVVFTLDNNGS